MLVLTMHRIEPTVDEWACMDAMPDRVIFQTREWLDFVARTQDATPVHARVAADGETVGWFTGLVIERFGLRILGSPFPGWTTATMGFNLPPSVDRSLAAAALVRFAFRELRCVHLELADRRLAETDLSAAGFRRLEGRTFEVDLTGDDDAVQGRMISACRRALRKAHKSGVVVETATDSGFAEEYHSQLEEVFARQSLTPTYGVDRVRALVDCLGDTGRLLRVRARAPDGRSIATAIFPAFNGTAYFWGGASRRADQILRPNEAVFWHAMTYWRARGIDVLDMGGGGDYKRRYGGAELVVPTFSRSRYPGLTSARDLAATVARARTRYTRRRQEALR